MKKIIFPETGKLIREAMAKIPGLSQEKLGESLGYTRGQFVSNICRGQAAFPFSRWIVLTTLLNVTIDQLKEAYLKDKEFQIQEAIKEQTKEQ